MSEMAERVSEAIHKLLPEFIYFDDVLRVAETALESMREPTDPMLARGITQADECNGDLNGGAAACTAEHVWRAMVDEALR